MLLIGLNRPAKRNAFDVAMIEQLAAAYYDLEHDEDIRCGVLFGHGEHFTGGLDLAEVGPLVREGRLDELLSAPGRRDPWRKDNVWTTPVVAAVQGWVMTLAIELLLAADIRIAASNCRFAQLRWPGPRLSPLLLCSSDADLVDGDQIAVVRVPALPRLVRNWTGLPAVFGAFAGLLLIPLPGFEAALGRVTQA